MQEGKATIEVESPKTVSKDMDVFYNPLMTFNRNTSIALLQALPKDIIGLPLAGSGVRGIRVLKECSIKEVLMNDKSPKAVKAIEHHIAINNIEEGKAIISRDDANSFLKQHHFDYIDIDPFGSPNPFLDSAVQALRKEGILAVTATDTAPLCGTYVKACRRKYWAQPLRNHLMHEVGLRILIRKVQLIGAQYDVALTPIMSYSKDHYFRIYFQSARGKKRVDVLLDQHGFIDEHDQEITINTGKTGPLWLGKLQSDILLKIKENDVFTKLEKKFMDMLTNEHLFEEKTQRIGFYDLHLLAKGTKLPIPRKERMEEALTKENIIFAWSHANEYAIKTDCSAEKIKEMMKDLS